MLGGLVVAAVVLYLAFVLMRPKRSRGVVRRKEANDAEVVSRTELRRQGRLGGVEVPGAVSGRNRVDSEVGYSPSRSGPPISPELEYDIEYGDADGVVTARRIRLIAVESGDYATYVRAYCRVRNSERTFRADRILSATWLSGPTTIADPEAHFFDLLPEEARPDPDHNAVMARVRPGLDVLIWIANADRQISADEQEALIDFIGERNGLAGEAYAAVPWSRAKATIYIDSARPTLASCSGILSKISKTGREFRLLKEYGGRIAEFGGEAGERRRKQLLG